MASPKREKAPLGLKYQRFSWLRYGAPRAWLATGRANAWIYVAKCRGGFEKRRRFGRLAGVTGRAVGVIVEIIGMFWGE